MRATTLKPVLDGLLLIVLSGLGSAWMPVSHAGIVRQRTDEKTTAAGPGALDDAGTVVFTGSSADLAGENPEHAYQVIRFDPVTGAASPVTAFRKGAALLVSVSDQGDRLAFASPSDLTGGNHDEGIELFLMGQDGSGLIQLTDEPAPNGGSVASVMISGDGSRVAFTANTDPLGTNLDRNTELFVIDQDGTGLVQLTQTGVGNAGAVSISDDGSRIVFTHDGDLTGGNPDLGTELYAVLSDGSGLRQLTATAAGFQSSAPSLAGNGSKAAFQSNGDPLGTNPNHQDEIFVVNWDGTGLLQLTSTRLVLGVTGDPASQAPSITDDGSLVFYHSNFSTLFPTVNLDGNFEIFRIGSDGTGRTMLTSTAFEAGSLLPAVSGSGNRVAYFGVDSQVTLRAMDGNGGAAVDLLVFQPVLLEDADTSPDGSRIVYTRSDRLFGGGEIWQVPAVEGPPAQVTQMNSGSPSHPSIASDNTTILFSADGNPTGNNLDGSGEIFRVQADGTGLVQLTSGPLGTGSLRPVIADGGSVVLFDSDIDPEGRNTDGSREIFRMLPGGGGLFQLTEGIAPAESRNAQVDDSGTWAVFESNADLDGSNLDGSYEIFRVRADGSAAPEAVTADPLLDARRPDISGAGDRVVYDSAADPLGTNGEGNREIFLYEPATGSRIQLTAFAEGDSTAPRFSRDGGWVIFVSDAPIAEEDPDRPQDLYRVPAAGGPVERISALRAGGGYTASPDGSGNRVGFSGAGNFTGGNLDALPEIWAIDGAGRSVLEVRKGDPTVLSWDPESGPLRYDVIRGDLSLLSTGVGGEVSLGPVVCVEDDSPDADTVDHGDPLQPAPGQALFFLVRGSRGLLDGPGSYGAGSGGGERTPSSGDCVKSGS